MEVLQKKFEPKQAELKNQNDELEGLKKQLTAQQDKLNEDALANLKKQIETKQKSFDRSLQDAQEEFGGQQQEIANRILNKMAPMIVKYAQENGFGLIIDIYNAQSGVPAPAAGTGAAAKPGVSKPTGTAPAKPAAPAPSTPKQ